MYICVCVCVCIYIYIYIYIYYSWLVACSVVLPFFGMCNVQVKNCTCTEKLTIPQHLSIYLSIYLSINLYIYLYIYIDI